MIEFAILKDETDHVPLLLSLFSAFKQIITCTGCYSPHGTHRLEKLGAIRIIIWNEVGSYALHADGQVGLTWGPLSLRCHAFLGKEGRCVKSQGVAAVSNSFSESLFYPSPALRSRTLGTRLIGRPAGALTYKVQNFQSIRSQCNEEKDMFYLIPTSCF